MDVPLGLPSLFGLCSSADSSAQAAEAAKAGVNSVFVSTESHGCVQMTNAAAKEAGRRTAERVSTVKKAVGTVPVGGVLGPTGILVPPAGTGSFRMVYSIFRKQVCSFKRAGIRLLLLDRQTSLADMRAAILASRGLNLPVVCCIAIGRETEKKFLPALITLQAMGAAAVGLCGIPGKTAESILRQALPHASVPLAFLADAEPGCSPQAFAESLRPLLDIGIRLIGCGQNTSPEHLRAAGNLRKKYGPPKLPEEPDCYAAATEWETFFLGDDLRFSRPIRCSSLLGDQLIRLGDEEVSAALVKIESISDARILGKNSSMTKLPIAIRSDSPAKLEAALRYFQGRLILDSNSPIEREILEPLATKYGAILY